MSKVNNAQCILMKSIKIYYFTLRFLLFGCFHWWIVIYSLSRHNCPFLYVFHFFCTILGGSCSKTIHVLACPFYLDKVEDGSIHELWLTQSTMKDSCRVDTGDFYRLLAIEYLH